MKTVLTVGVFDLLHYGHFELFRRAKELAGKDGKLTVAIQKDEYVTKYKPQTKLFYELEYKSKNDFCFALCRQSCVLYRY